MSLRQGSVEAIKASLENVTSDSTTGIHGLAAIVVDKSGKQLISHCAGVRNPYSNEPVTLDTVFWIASCSKLITAIAAVQLVEQGKLHLDDSEEANRLAPELKALQVLEDDGTLRDKKTDITLRQLLTHTAGMGYWFISHKLERHGRTKGLGTPGLGYNHLHGDFNEYTKTPLIHEPGSQWEYSVSSLS
jgi:CubicO group peptidase (beta-lactamase class C family)